jgi:predicted Rossmann fold flavoprotein
LDFEWDVIVVGAGPAGLLAACRAAELGRKTLLLERNRKAGVKILMSGGTRCNLTQATDAAGIVAAFGKPGRFLHSALASLGPDGLVEMIEAEGVRTKVESTGKVFPVSDRAVDVQQALLHRLGRSGCRLLLERRVHGFRPQGGEFLVSTAEEELRCRRLIVTSGGKSYPGCGTTGDGYDWLRRLGHTIVSPRPALVPITSPAHWIHGLQGVTLANAVVRVVRCERDPSAAAVLESTAAELTFRRESLLAECRGSVLMTHFGLSGPAVLNVSRTVTAEPVRNTLALRIDLVPDLSPEQLDEAIRRQCAEHGGRTPARVLASWLPQRLAEAIAEQCGLAGHSRVAELTRASRRAAVAQLKHLFVPIQGTLGFGKAEVTAGGVSLDEIDSRSLESKLVPGLCVAGELLDLDGPIGGYNFQAAFSTGWLAGQSAAG